MQTYIDTRIADDQPLIDALAFDFLQPEDIKELETGLDMKANPNTKKTKTHFYDNPTFPSIPAPAAPALASGAPAVFSDTPADSMSKTYIQFRPMEYIKFTTRFPTPKNYRRRVVELYKYILTIDRWLSKVRGLYAMVAEMNNISSDSVNAMIKNELIHPSFIPWETLESKDMSKLDFKQQADLSLRSNSTIGLPPEFQAHPGDDGKAKYLCQYPLIGSLIAITQGLYLDDPETKQPVWVNATVPATNHARSWIKGGPFGMFDSEFSDKMMANDPTLNAKRPTDEAIKQNPQALFNWEEQKREFKQKNETKLRSLWYLNLEEFNGTGKICNDLQDSFGRVGGTSTLYNMFNKLMQTFQSVIAHSTRSYSRQPKFFLSDSISGPNYGSNLQCGPGQMPKFVGYDNQPLSPEDSMFTYQGKTYVSSKVDPLKSSCMVMGIVREIDEKGKPHEDFMPKTAETTTIQDAEDVPVLMAARRKIKKTKTKAKAKKRGNRYGSNYGRIMDLW